MIIAGKRVLVTGAAAGIGRAIARALADQHAELILLDVDEPGLRELAESLRSGGTQVSLCACDLKDPSRIDAILQEMVADFGGVDIVINNAGVAYYGGTTKMTDQQWADVVAVNLLAPAQIVRRLLPSLQERRQGHIVNISSIAGLAGFKRTAAYSLTKFGLVGFSESLRYELAREGIGVTAVCPGFVRTSMFESATSGRRRTKLRSWLASSPELVAAQVVRAIRKNRPLVVVGLTAKLVWRLKRLSPMLFNATFGGRRRARSR